MLLCHFWRHLVITLFDEKFATPLLFELGVEVTHQFLPLGKLPLTAVTRRNLLMQPDEVVRSDYHPKLCFYYILAPLTQKGATFFSQIHVCCCFRK